MSTLSIPRPAAPGDERPESTRTRLPRRTWLLIALVLAAGTVLRLVARSDLWLDEAQSVAIATRPLSELPAALRTDGAPPLYYVLLHAWTAVFGTSDLAVRVPSGLASLAALPVVFALGQRLGGRPTAVAALLVLVSSPFAIRYATEARMYSLVVLLSAVAGLLLLSVLARPGWRAQLGLAVLTGLLLLTHYWAIFLAAATVLGLAWRWRRGPAAARPAAGRALVAVMGGGVLFLPWVPVFLFQTANTGAPWAAAPSLGDLVDVVGAWGASGSYLGSALTSLLLGMLVLGVAGRPAPGRGVLLGRPGTGPGPVLMLLTAGTLVLAFLASLSGGAFVGRYTAVVLVPALLVVALGLRALPTERARALVLGVVVVLGLVAGVEPSIEQRTQAGAVADVVAEQASAGDVVVYCPDQLGPSVSRLLAEEPGLRQVVYPTAAAPAMVDWVDYAERNRAASGADFAREVDGAIADGADVWLVWMAGYRTFGRECTDLAITLENLRPGSQIEVEIDRRKFERMQLVRYPAG